MLGSIWRALGRGACRTSFVFIYKYNPIAAVNTALRIKGTLTSRRIQQYKGAGYEMCKDRLSPLQRIELQADQILSSTSQMEEKVASVAPPWWTPPHISIAAIASEAAKYHDKIQQQSNYQKTCLFSRTELNYETTRSKTASSFKVSGKSMV
jgi:hypothetical protein